MDNQMASEIRKLFYARFVKIQIIPSPIGSKKLLKF